MLHNLFRDISVLLLEALMFYEDDTISVVICQDKDTFQTVHAIKLETCYSWLHLPFCVLQKQVLP